MGTSRLRSMLHIHLIGRRVVRRLTDKRLMDKMCPDEREEKAKVKKMLSDFRSLSTKRFFHYSGRIVRG